MSGSEFDGTAAVAGPASFQKVSVGRQVLRRELNDRARARHDGADEEFEVFCECGRAGCRDGVIVTTGMYEALRRVPTHFLVKRSHAGSTERVVESHEDFLIVEKFGRSGLEAIQLERGKRRLRSGSA